MMVRGYKFGTCRSHKTCDLYDYHYSSWHETWSVVQNAVIFRFRRRTRFDF